MPCRNISRVYHFHFHIADYFRWVFFIFFFISIEVKVHYCLFHYFHHFQMYYHFFHYYIFHFIAEEIYAITMTHYASSSFFSHYVETFMSHYYAITTFSFSSWSISSDITPFLSTFSPCRDAFDIFRCVSFSIDELFRFSFSFEFSLPTFLHVADFATGLPTLIDADAATLFSASRYFHFLYFLRLCGFHFFVFHFSIDEFVRCFLLFQKIIIIISAVNIYWWNIIIYAVTFSWNFDIYFRASMWLSAFHFSSFSHFIFATFHASSFSSFFIIFFIDMMTFRLSTWGKFLSPHFDADIDIDVYFAGADVFLHFLSSSPFIFRGFLLSDGSLSFLDWLIFSRFFSPDFQLLSFSLMPIFLRCFHGISVSGFTLFFFFFFFSAVFSVRRLAFFFAIRWFRCRCRLIILSTGLMPLSLRSLFFSPAAWSRHFYFFRRRRRLSMLSSYALALILPMLIRHFLDFQGMIDAWIIDVISSLFRWFRWFSLPCASTFSRFAMIISMPKYYRAALILIHFAADLRHCRSFFLIFISRLFHFSMPNIFFS